MGEAAMMGEAEDRVLEIARMSMSGASAANVMVAVASAVFRLNPVRARQAPVRKWVTGSKVYYSHVGRTLCHRL